MIELDALAFVKWILIVKGLAERDSECFGCVPVVGYEQQR